MRTPDWNEIVGLQQVLTRAADAETFDAWLRRAKATGWCRNPVRLVGAVERINGQTGEVIGHFGSSGLPDHTLLKACGQRRATRCPTCSATYQADAYQLVAAGLRGAKGIPDSVSGHPVIFVTLTAPSFGTVHTRRPAEANPRTCQHADDTCQHGLTRSCLAIHEPNDELVGQPICPDCFEYPAAVLWNAHAGELWRRTTIGIARALASLAGIPRGELRRTVRISFAKVVEYQRRGSVHVHTVVRLDAAGETTEAPPPQFDADLLAVAVARAIRSASVPVPSTDGVAGAFRWGPQLDLRPIGNDGVVPKAVAGYLAKYATKSTDPAGLLDTRVRAGDLDSLDEALSSHLARMVRTAWDLGGRPELEHLRLRNWAHALGFRGHWLTKSRVWSTTFAELRSTRRDWQRANAGDPVTEEELSIGEWQYAGRGWTTAGDSWLAETAARRTAETRSMARVERRTAPAAPTGR
ncbi:MAG: replication initiator [Acidimicrobiales bacterium]